MMLPDSPVRPSVPNPEMWSACRCVATTAVSRPLSPPQTRWMSAATIGMYVDGLGDLVPFDGSSVVPKSMRTWRCMRAE